MNQRRGTFLCAAVILVVLPLVVFGTSDVHAQSRAATPIAGHYPGGHVGLRGGATPPEGLGVFNFNRFSIAGNLKDANGNTIGNTDRHTYTNITGAQWVTETKILGMNYGMLLAVPFNDTYNRPNGQSTESTGVDVGKSYRSAMGQITARSTEQAVAYLSEFFFRQGWIDPDKVIRADRP